jgi:hypothetical protein
MGLYFIAKGIDAKRCLDKLQKRTIWKKKSDGKVIG